MWLCEGYGTFKGILQIPIQVVPCKCTVCGLIVGIAQDLWIGNQ